MARNILVTGGSSGLGLECMKKIIQQGNVAILTARTEDEIRTAMVTIQESSPKAPVHGIIFDLINPDFKPLSKLLATLPTENVLHGVINNAGIAGDLPWETVPEDRKNGELSIRTNFFGTKQVTEGLDSFLADDAFIVNVSTVWYMKNMSKAHVTRLQGADENELDKMANEFIDRYYKAPEVKAYDEESGIFLEAYGFSKALLNRLTMLQQEKWPKRSITSCTPGWVATPMTIGMPNQEELLTVEQGATDILESSKSSGGRFHCLSKYGREGINPMEDYDK